MLQLPLDYRGGLRLRRYTHFASFSSDEPLRFIEFLLLRFLSFVRLLFSFQLLFYYLQTIRNRNTVRDACIPTIRIGR